MIKSLITKKLFIIILLTILSVMALQFCKSKYMKIETVDKIEATTVKTVGEMVSDKFIKQTFHSKKQNLNNLDLFMSTFDRINTSNLTIEIRDEDNVIRTISFHAKDVKNNDYNKFYFDPIKDSMNKDYSFIVYSEDANIENSITLWCNPKNTNSQFEFGQGIVKSGSIVFNLGFAFIFSWINVLKSAFVLSLVNIVLYYLFKFFKKY